MSSNNNRAFDLFLSLILLTVPIIVLSTSFLIVSSYTANLIILIAGTIILAWLILTALITVVTCAVIAFVLISDKF